MNHHYHFTSLYLIDYDKYVRKLFQNSYFKYGPSILLKEIVAKRIEADTINIVTLFVPV